MKSSLNIHYTPWKFNIAPENIPSQKESSLPTIIFQGRAVKRREGMWCIWGFIIPPIPRFFFSHHFSLCFSGAIAGPEGEFCRFKSDGYLGFSYEILVLPLVSYPWMETPGIPVGKIQKKNHHPEKNMYECAGQR